MARSLTIHWRRQKTFSKSAYEIVNDPARWRRCAKAPYLASRFLTSPARSWISGRMLMRSTVVQSRSGALHLRRGLVRVRPGQGDARPQTSAPARQSRRPETARQAGVRPGADAGRSSGALDRLLLARLSRRSQGAAGRRRVLAGRAPVAQSHVGKPGDDRLPRALLTQGEGRGRLERHSGRRHFAAARRPDADRPRLPSGRARRRHLAHSDAEPHAVAARSARPCRRSTW